MTIMQRLGQINNSIETERRARSFVHVVRHLAFGDGNALAHAKTNHASPEIIDALKVKTAIAVGTTSDPTWAAPLAAYNGMVAAFLETVPSAFDRMLPAMFQIPLRTRIAVTTLGIDGSIVVEGKPTPLGKIELSGNDFTENKAVAIVVVSNELARFGGLLGAELLGRALRNAIALVTDEKFVSLIVTGLTPIASSGGTPAAIRADLAAALAEIDTDAASNLFALMDSPTAKALSSKSNTDGSRGFPDMSPMGGVLDGMPVIVTGGVPTRHLVIADAAGIAAYGGAVEVDRSQQSALQLDTVPDDPTTASTVLTSLFQHNLTALKALRFFAAYRMRDAVAVIDTQSYSSPE